jgi:hypothetical protein
VKKAKINFENFPGKYGQFVILDLESKKKNLLMRARPKGALSVFGYKIIYGAK